MEGKRQHILQKTTRSESCSCPCHAGISSDTHSLPLYCTSYRELLDLAPAAYPCERPPMYPRKRWLGGTKCRYVGTDATENREIC